MRPGSRHRLELQRLPDGSHARWVDPYDAGVPRYRALRTDRARRRSRIVITVRGGGGTYHRISFERPKVIVGSRLDADVLLADADVAPQHLRLEPAGDHTAVIALGRAAVSINGKPLAAQTRRVISYKDRLTVGPYTLQVSLLTPRWLDRHGR